MSATNRKRHVVRGPAELRFEAKTARGEGDDACWLWTAGKDKDGYGKFTVQRPDGSGQRHVRAHTFAWERAHGPVPAGMVLMHRCDTPACVRVDHLRLGTVAENVADRVAKGRSARGLRSGHYTKPERMPRGARHGNSTIGEEQARRVRELLGSGLMPAEIAGAMRISVHVVRQIRAGKTWRHVA